MYIVMGVVLVLWMVCLSRVRTMRDRATRDEGASALEWAVISAILVTAAVVIGGVIYGTVNTKKDVITRCANQAANATNC